MASVPRLSANEAPASPAVDEIVRTLVELVPTHLFVVNDSGHYVYINPAARATDESGRRSMTLSS